MSPRALKIAHAFGHTPEEIAAIDAAEEMENSLPQKTPKGPILENSSLDLEITQKNQDDSASDDPPLGPSDSTQHSAFGSSFIIPDSSFTNEPSDPNDDFFLPPNVQINLTDKQLTAIHLLMQGMSYLQIAKSLGINRKTLYKWRQNPFFVNEINSRRTQLWNRTDARLCYLLQPALDLLQRQLADPNATTSARAAVNLLRLANVRQSKTDDEAQ